MPLRERNDTIAAVATPVGEGGIAVIRVSGGNAVALCDSLFAGKKPLLDVPSHTVHHGRFLTGGGETIDEVLVSVFRAPHSYTGEESVEISCHGGMFITNKILYAVLSKGARTADPGEFTLRAFLNGKMDLTQAEAVAALIHAKTEKSHAASLAQLSGGVTRRVEHFRTNLIDLCSLLELELDFSQEGVELTKRDDVIEKLDNTITDIKKFTTSYLYGRVLRDGVKVVLTGKPNAGKSSLLNILLQQNRAIVSEIPGTTRDVIEENLSINGLLVRLVDTAGIRQSEDIIEEESIRRTHEELESASVIAVMIDSSEMMTKNDSELYHSLLRVSRKNKSIVIFLLNKSDLTNREFSFDLPLTENESQMFISCLTGDGIPEFKQRLFKISLPNYDSGSSSILLQNERHKVALEKAVEKLDLARQTLANGLSSDFVAVDLRAALDYLGEIIGITTPDDILQNIFSKFCIGK
ncbi:MAG: tRNA uridine-5-carboxymethylaminomethyl(34) synthesis GTPase MnmE [Bacteroidota bacterium]|nr:tRNA uridine-5-carboxymethylaminomethyl(34) synthesis GTPase MnmE [Bacteroidota bacterium]